MPQKKSPKPAAKSRSAPPVISIRGCRQHNLRGLDLDIPLGKLTVVTGPSGSGKSSLAFHTLYAEGQRRYVETFSPYVRQFFDRMDKPDVDHLDGIPPAIAIEQKNNVRTTRSTVGTLTEINDYLKLLFARMATGHDPATGDEIRPDTPESACDWAHANLTGKTALVVFPVSFPPGTPVAEACALLNAQGYLRILLGNEVIRTDEPPASPKPATVAEVDVVQDRVTVGPRVRTRLSEALEAAFRLGKGRAALVPDGGAPRRFTSTWTHPDTGFTLRPPTPALFSFNNPLGACPVCRGFGRVIGIDLEKAVPDPTLSISGGAVKPFVTERGDECQRDLLRNCKERRIDIRAPWEDLDPEVREWVLYGDPKSPALSDLENSEALWQEGKWYGVKGFFDWMESKAYKMHVRVFLSRYRSYTTCATCRGRRLQPEALCFRVNGKTLPDLWAMSVAELRGWFTALVKNRPASASDSALATVLTEITSRVGYLDEVGLGYLTLDRPTRTLSGGEIERVNLTTCLGASLTGTLFVLDEPTVGLHQRDIRRLVGVMHGLRDKGNTLVVVEHEERIMRAADHLIDLGPGAGAFGGQLLHAGPPTAGPGAKKAEGTLPWLSGARSIPVPSVRRKPDTRVLGVRGATRHNLRKLDADIPLGVFVCLTGVSGSGKSTFARDVIYHNLARKFGMETEGDPAPVRQLAGTEHLGGVELVDQTPVARTPRSTPAVFLGAFEPIRQLFCETEAARAAGLKPGFFSFNSGDGRCDRCGGNGFERVEMQFLSDIYVTCPDCDGRRYKASTLDHTWGGKSIAGVLDLTVSEAVVFLQAGARGASVKQEKLAKQALAALQPLLDVGLGYLKLGQPLNTLSGGEAQRLKLCVLLSGAAAEKGKTKLLILDEPTTGLHFADIANLLGVFDRLVTAGHSLLVIEHNLDVIKCADWILDLGPEAGEGGGRLVAAGPPEAVAKLDTPTAGFLRQALGGSGKAGRAEKEKRRPVAEDRGMISLKGARHHNLKNVSLEIPRDQLVVVSGLSGSGKSTLAFDILFAEGQRRFLDSMSAYARQFAEQLEKPEIDQLAGLPPTVAIEQRVSQGGGKSTVATVTELWNFIRLLYSKLGTPHCPDCRIPVARQSVAAIEKLLLERLAEGGVAVFAPLIRGRKGYHTDIGEWAARHGFGRLLVDGEIRDSAERLRLERFREHDIDVEVAAFARLGRDSSSGSRAEAINKALGIGKGILKLRNAGGKIELLSTKSSCPGCNRSFDDLDPRLFSFNSPHGWCPSCRGHGRVPRKRYQIDMSRFDSVLAAELDADRAIERMEDTELVECPACHGHRLNPVAAAVTLERTRIADLANLSIDRAAEHFAGLAFDGGRDSQIARDILPEIRQRLEFLREVGLGYLQLDRSANTLSGGESQRIRLAAQLGSNLRGVLYVLDEPTIGLHPRDNVSLLRTLTNLRDHGNSLIVVEHDEDTIAAADHLVDLGPGAGRLGGEVVYQGSPPKPGASAAVVRRHPDSPTWRALTMEIRHPMRGKRRTVSKDHPALGLSGCVANNLKSADVRIPLGRLTVLTGISGSGKSSLMHGCVAVAASGARKAKDQLPFAKATGFEQIKSCYEVDQSPIGKTSRSCPATYVKVFDDIRALFAQLPEARVRGYEASRFSFNTEGGRCPDCNGNGRVKLEMDFLPPTWVPCETCRSERYNPATLEVTFRGRNIGQVLDMTIDEAAVFFESQPRIAAPLRLLADTGLGYLQLGQPSPTLSGGEAQRIKLVSELTKGRSIKQRLNDAARAGRNLYLIEEPTVGLHREDVQRLIEVLHRLVDEGHTVVVIEHHMAVAAEADWIIDLGPEAGEGGGRVVAQGPPEKIVAHKSSRTAPFLKPFLANCPRK
ncbi:MAG: excinuclease ABC subunit UvrA [Verrucomicrobia bacterium]|nr:excinuclease ABC subunit UvrA [Verrucomicrobiota bacterium]